jgi:hypothetical protein
MTIRATCDNRSSRKVPRQRRNAPGLAKTLGGLDMPKGTYPRRSVAERLWPKVNKDGPIPEHRPELGPCWVWTGSTVGSGYGQIEHQHRHWRVHRLVYVLTHGPIPDGLDVLHSCDNPPCCNPAHLRVGSKPQNMREASSRGRISRGTGRWNARLSPESVRAIRVAASQGMTHVAIGQRFGVSRAAVGHIVNRKRWAWVK